MPYALNLNDHHQSDQEKLYEVHQELAYHRKEAEFWIKRSYQEIQEAMRSLEIAYSHFSQID